MANQETSGHGGGSPQIFSADNLNREWLARGTDGFMYRFPDEPGGWKRRQRYDGENTEIVLLMPEDARAVFQRVEGDFAGIAIARE